MPGVILRSLLSAHLLAALVFCCHGCHLCVGLQLPVPADYPFILSKRVSLPVVYHGAAHCAPFCTDTCLWLIRLYIAGAAWPAVTLCTRGLLSSSPCLFVVQAICRKSIARPPLVVVHTSCCTRVSCVSASCRRFAGVVSYAFLLHSRGATPTALVPVRLVLFCVSSSQDNGEWERCLSLLWHHMQQADGWIIHMISTRRGRPCI